MQSRSRILATFSTVLVVCLPAGADTDRACAGPAASPAVRPLCSPGVPVDRALMPFAPAPRTAPHATSLAPPCATLPLWDSRCEAWATTYDHARGHVEDPAGYYGIDRPRGSAVSPDGSIFYVTGHSYDPATSYDATTVATDADTGLPAWVARYDGGDPVLGDAGLAVAPSPDGALVVTAGAIDLPLDSSMPRTTGSVATVAYDARTGAQRWDRTLKVSGRVDSAIGVTVDGTTAYVVAAVDRKESATLGDILVLAYDLASGDERWRATYDSGAGDFPLGISVAGDAVFVAGSAYYRPDPTRDSYYLQEIAVAYDAATGVERWRAALRGTAPGSYMAQAFGFAVAPDGSAVYVAGGTDDPQTVPLEVTMTTAAFDGATGALRWTASRKGAFGAAAMAVAVAPDGRTVYTTGAVIDSALAVYEHDVVTIAYDATSGAQRWSARYAGPRADWEWGTDVSADRSGTRVYVTGLSGTTAGIGVRGDYVTLSYDAATGAQQWVARLNTDISQSDLDVDPDVRHALSADGTMLFVAGAAIHQSPVPNAYDFGLAAYTTG